MRDVETPAEVPRSIGARVLRKEDRRLLTGRGTYVDDVSLPRMAHACFVRSTDAHAELAKVDAAAARRVPGVIAVLTAADLEGRVKPIRALNSTPGYQECDTPVLATGKVRMVGEPVALVVAESRYAAEDGAAAVGVSYRPLTPLVEIEDAIADGAPAIHDEIEGNIFNRFEAESGDVDGAFERAQEVIELELRQQRYGAAPMEGRAVVADPVGASGLEVWLSSQVPHIARTGLAKFLSMPETAIRVISPDVGGGFGPKCVLYQEDVAVSAAALILGRPVKWIGDRVEDLLTTVHGREQVHRIRGALTGDGRVLAVDVEILSSNGAYAPWPFTAGLDSGQASENVTGPYDIGAYRRRVRAVVTNKCPMGPYRGVGRVIACLTIERLLDEAASRLGLDRLEIRRRNVVREFPHETPAGLVFESGDYLRSLEMLADAIDWDRESSGGGGVRGGGRLRGVGVACAVEHSAYGPKSLGSRNHELTLGYDTASLRVEPDGKLRLAVGLHSHGQGQETTMAQVVADELGVDPSDVEVVFGDTAIVPYGNGTWASRSTVYCGGAAVLAARDVREKALELAADMLEASPADLEISSGTISVRGTPGRGVPFADVARRAGHEPHLLPEGIEPGLESTRRYQAPDPGSFSSAMHAAVVEVDPGTGNVAVLRYAVVEDCGTVINPTIVEGQVHGGVAQGIGGALSEHLVYDESGQLVTASFMDYLLPTAAEIPPMEIRHLESPSPHTIGGWKGMGEGGSINAPAAVVSAVNDALSHLGITANHTPLDPAWVRTAIRSAEPLASGAG
jgi:aerobic carbon-monoxide dehydrogenase large subunit